jgi:hypothetical protein
MFRFGTANSRSKAFLRGLTYPKPPVLKARYLIIHAQRRSFASHPDFNHDAEKVERKRMGQFDLNGKVFVVTGADSFVFRIE